MTMKMKAAAAVALLGMAALSACGGSDADAGEASGGAGAELSLVGFSVLEAANKEATAAFAKTGAGKGVTVVSSYGASGDQSRAVEAGKAADIVHFSLEPDISRLVDAGIVAKDWKDNPTKGIASQSVVVFVVRPGNPERIQTWDDLTKDGVEVITPNPASSGSAKWNILAALGHTIAAGGSEAEAESYLKDLLGNTVALPESGRDATTLFTGGTGDVLLSYENEAILAKQNGADFDYVVPDTTLLIENPAAVTEDAKPQAQDFLDFLTSADGQSIYARYGFRPLTGGEDVEVEGANDPADPFPTPKTLLRIDKDFGGWSEANPKYFDEESGIVPKLQKATGTQ